MYIDTFPSYTTVDMCMQTENKNNRETTQIKKTNSAVKQINSGKLSAAHSEPPLPLIILL